MSYTSRKLEKCHAEKLNKFFGVEDALHEFNPGKCLMPPYFSEIAQEILDCEIRDNDVWLVSFPRTGSTWAQEMIWAIGNDFDLETARNTIQQLRAPLIELSTIIMADMQDFFTSMSIRNSVEFVANQPSPRYIKTHLPLELCPVELDKTKPKIIYTARNPKDLCVSYYHYCQMFHNLDNVTFEEFAELFINDLTPLGSIWNHFLGFWNKRHETNILFLKYEDMKRDLRGTLDQIAAFLGKTITEEQKDELEDFLSVDKMRENKGCNLQALIDARYGVKDYYKKTGKHFIRKGEVGDWKNHMTPELSERFDRWIEENTKGTGLSFD